MARHTRKRSKKIGLAPGTLVHIGEKKTEKVRLRLIDYDSQQLQERDLGAIEECFPLKDEPTITWVNIDGIHDVEIIEKIGKHFDIHPLTLEDIVNTEQRPKMEDYEDYIFIVSKMLHYDEERHAIRAEQFSLILRENYIITFQEVPGDVFAGVRERLRKSKGRIRKAGADYLAYALMDAVVDHYFIILEKFGERIESLEEDLVTRPNPQTLQSLHDMKREMIFFRKQIWPLREIISNLAKAEAGLIRESTGIYLRDVYDHTIQVIDTVESFRDILAGMLDIYLSSISNRMNEVMKVLTIIATIFIPLTFIAGIYGMNFKYMPELEWPWGYFGALSAMAVIAAVMVYYFRKKGWI